MSTGLGEAVVPQDVAMQKLLLCFIVVYERQILSRAFTYMFHNDSAPEEFDNCMHLSMKFSTLSPNGIAAELRPYLQKAHAQGYLEPEDCDNAFSKCAIDLFPKIHAEWDSKGEVVAKKWAMSHVFQLLTDPNAVAEEALLAGDVDEWESGELEEPSLEEQSEEQESEEDYECTCDLCEEMRTYATVDLDALETSDPLDRIIIEGMKKALKV